MFNVYDVQLTFYKTICLNARALHGKVMKNKTHYGLFKVDRLQTKLNALVGFAEIPFPSSSDPNMQI